MVDLRRVVALQQSHLTKDERLRANAARYRSKHPERLKPKKIYNQRIYTLKNKFNMTLEDYAKLLEAQEGRCAICRHKPQGLDSYRKGKNLAVDHNHTTNKNRGLLCDKCNRGIGHFNDNPELLLKAIEYLRRYEDAKTIRSYGKEVRERRNA